MQLQLRGCWPACLACLLPALQSACVSIRPPCLALPPSTHRTCQVNGRLRELHTTLEAGDRLREGVLQGMALNLDAWSIQVRALLWSRCGRAVVKLCHCCGRWRGREPGRTGVGGGWRLGLPVLKAKALGQPQRCSVFPS